MPLYESMCHQCGKVHNYYKPAARYLETPECCGQRTEKVILTPPFGVVDIPAYQSPVSGKWINSRKQRTEDLKQAGCRPWEGMEQEQKEAARQQEYQEQAHDAFLDKALGENLAAMTA